MNRIQARISQTPRVNREVDVIAPTKTPERPAKAALAQLPDKDALKAVGATAEQREAAQLLESASPILTLIDSKMPVDFTKEDREMLGNFVASVSNEYLKEAGEEFMKDVKAQSVTEPLFGRVIQANTAALFAGVAFAATGGMAIAPVAIGVAAVAGWAALNGVTKRPEAFATGDLHNFKRHLNGMIKLAEAELKAGES